jgi:hypothetical protein
MSNLVIVSGDFSSGTTLLFTLFRKMGGYYCLYEPLHEKLLEYLIVPLRAYEHHFFVDDYFAEYKGFSAMPQLFDPKFASNSLYLPPEAPADDLYRYLSYLIGTAFGRSKQVMLKENRISFRLGWIRAKFAQAKIIHIYREKDSQWNSIVRRAQAHVGKEDVGQGEVTFNGMNIAKRCDALAADFPELDASRSKTGYERFSKLWDIIQTEHRRYADISVEYGALTHDFENTFQRVLDCVGTTADLVALKQYVIAPEEQERLKIQPSNPKRLQRLFDRAARRYAEIRLGGKSSIKGRTAR